MGVWGCGKAFLLGSLFQPDAELSWTVKEFCCNCPTPRLFQVLPIAEYGIREVYKPPGMGTASIECLLSQVPCQALYTQHPGESS